MKHARKKFYWLKLKLVWLVIGYMYVTSHFSIVNNSRNSETLNLTGFV